MLKLLKRLSAAVLISLGLYSLLGYLVLPTLGVRLINQQLAQYAKLPANLERLEFDPFALKLSLHGFTLGEPKKPQLSFERFSAHLAWDSLWQGKIHLFSLELERPAGQITRAANGQLNLQQWFKIPSSPSDNTESSPPSIQIDSVRLLQGHWQFQDSGLREPVNLSLEDLNIELRQLSTQGEQAAQLSLVARNKNGQQIDWQGELQLKPLQLKGQLKVQALDLRQIRPYLSAAMPLVLEKGSLNLSSEVQLSLAQSLQLKLDNLSLSGQSLSLSSRDKRPLLRLAELNITKTSVDLAKRQISIGQINSQKLETWAAREADGELDWQKLFASPSVPATTKPTAAKPSSSDSGWRLSLDHVQLRDYQIHLADRQPKEPVNLELGPLNLDLRNLDTAGQKPLSFLLNTQVGSLGKLKAEGQLNLSAGRGTLQLATNDLDLRLAQAYLAPFIQLELRSGLLASNLGIELNSTQPLAFRVSGQAEISQLHTLETRQNRDLLKWQRLTLAGIDYRHQEQLNIGKIDVIQPYARFIINPDLSSNLSDLLVKSSSSAPTAKASPSAPPKSESKTEAGLGIQIGAIKVINGSGYFADLSLEPDFATSIQTLNGEIGSLDNRQPKAARVSFKGKVDRYSPVSVEGNLSLFDPLHNLDIVTRFQQLEMTNLTPYSGKFAGYRIRKGRLDLDLHYRIQQRQLKADNKIVVHQLQLGEQVDSPSSAGIPVRLAIALLKDSSGTITLDVPIQGNLDDPSFSVMPLIGHALGNLLSKAVQAPFKLLSGLIDSGPEDLGHILFPPGKTALEAEARLALDKLAIALKERPNLMLEVEGSSDPALDGRPLAEQQMEQEYRKLWYRTLQRQGKKVPSSPEKLQVSDDEKDQMLDELYRARLKQEPPAEWAKLDQQSRYQRLRQATLDSWSKSQTLLRQLSQTRAASIKEYLVSQGRLDNTRIYLLDNNLSAHSDNGKIATPLYLAGQ